VPSVLATTQYDPAPHTLVSRFSDLVAVLVGLIMFMALAAAGGEQ
jgi:hypothetical protein